MWAAALGLRPVALIAIGLAAVGFGAVPLAWHTGRAPLQHALSTLRAEYADYRAAVLETAVIQARAAARELIAAQARGQALELKLSEQLLSITQTQAQRHAQITAHTTGRACLGPGAVRLLNAANAAHAAPRAPAHVPATALGPGAAHANATPPLDTSADTSADAPALSDTDVAAWAVAAQGQYAQCATRLGALIDWVGAYAHISYPAGPRTSDPTEPTP